MSQKITILDAGMGKALKMQGVEIPETIWSANALLVAPEKVQSIHEENILAGANMITTNTYGVIRSDLKKAGIENQFETLNLQAAGLARAAIKATGKVVKIAGSLPPLNGSFRPDRVRSVEEIEPLYREQAEILAPHVDVFLCETMSHINEAIAAARAARSTGKPVIVSFTLHEQNPGKLRSGQSLEDAINGLGEVDLEGLCANCSLPERISDAMPILAKSNLKYVGGYANAFTHVPEDWLLDGEKITDGPLELRDDLSPEIYSKFVGQWINQGATLVGGCCGTLPSHIAAIATSLRSQ
ncbi:MAG: homocysteine S-methyltransferase family protein [Gammaproteobacteria bacterium]|jgi:S-methylmethionine-dependent homocysteine/selenocysteine methylase|nr:homocysteine S-methyltransferase family protein [Gammaproteobacteria bacterium]MBT3867304.1 homocysteine S-methyltransferase family protein [Gammaproteobacteria bacterium]MBT4377804.1 homocysteine S-methyltransferase family protein [Gammaproteobacteria bacterium]MBT6569938.1 homocysteine S-methyltransferase family protein [Gammaproteobacteria bacterium]MBT7175219.1 homocysteine S-methyltransferase family protein [Gammaproteobacteria bacterium]